MIQAQKKWILIALCACLVVGALLIVLSNTVWKKTAETGEETEVFMVPPLSLGEIAEIRVQNQSASYRLYRGEDGELYFEGAEYVLYNANMIAFLRTCTAYLSVSGEVQNPEPFLEYGLTEETCLASFSVTPMEGESYRVLIGSKLVGEEGYYARLEKDARVFVLESSLENCLFSDVNFYLSAQVAPTLSSSTYYDISDFYIKKNDTLYVEIEKTPEAEVTSEDMSTHRLCYPAQYEPNTTLVAAIFKSFSSFVGSAVEEYGLVTRSAEEFSALLQSYGFVDAQSAQMYCEIGYTYGDTQTTLFVSRPDTEQGVYYLYSPGFDIIASFGADTLAWVDYDLMEFTQAELFARSIGNVASITVKGEDVTETTFTLTHGEVASDLVVKDGTTVISTAYFRQFYNQILYIKNEGYAEIPADLSKLPQTFLTIRMNDGTAYSYVFYDTSSRQSYYQIDGEGVFYINRDYVKKFVSDAVLLKTNQAVEARQFS